jgi:ABC-2 type transport system ATP-binding protein
VIEVDGLVKRYRKATHNAVDGISFRVGAGEFFALLGPNGAGKTTTISILTTTLQPTGGRATIDGHDVVTAASEVRRRVGIIFQRPSVDRNLTAEENIRFHAVLFGLYPYRPAFGLMPAAYRRQVRELSGMLGIEGDLGKPIRTFSGGMMRKLEIVRSLLHRPAVLFLDEPTAGLDAPTRRTLWEHLRTVRHESGTTIFLTSHYLEEAEQADRICIVDHGRIVSEGTPAALKAGIARETLIVDAPDRARLAAELATLGMAPVGEGPFRLSVNGRSAHAMLKAIDTPLSVVRTESPSLEDAYLEIVSRAEVPNLAVEAGVERAGDDVPGVELDAGGGTRG